jgi:hypothetical protein
MYYHLELADDQRWQASAWQRNIHRANTGEGPGGVGQVQIDYLKSL